MNKVERRQVLLRAARDVFATKGYHDAKIDDIVAEAKVAKGTFYLYFLGQTRRLLRAGRPALPAPRRGDPQGGHGRDVEGQIKHNIRAIVAVLLDDPALTKILFSTRRAGSSVRRARSVVLRRREDAARGEPARGAGTGDRERRRHQVFATFTVGALKEMVFETVTATTPVPREEIVDALFASSRAATCGSPRRRRVLVDAPAAWGEEEEIASMLWIGTLRSVRRLDGSEEAPDELSACRPASPLWIRASISSTGKPSEARNPSAAPRRRLAAPRHPSRGGTARRSRPR